MKYWLTVFLIVSVLGVAVFGFLGMNHNNGHVGCIASAAQNGACPRENSPFGLVSFFMDALRSFSNAILFGFVFLAVLVLTLFLTNRNLPELSCLVWQKEPTPAKNNFRHNFILWLTLHEKRDPSARLSFQLLA